MGKMLFFLRTKMISQLVSNYTLTRRNTINPPCVASKDSYSLHFASDTPILGEPSKSDVQKGSWKTNVVKRGQLGSLVEYLPESAQSPTECSVKEVSFAH